MSRELDAPRGKQWDLLVLGGGTAGIVTAQTAQALGASVLLVEADRMGGDCLWTGCVPSKSLLAAAHQMPSAGAQPRLGVTGAPTVDFGAVMDHVRSAIAAIEPDDSAETLGAMGIRVVSGRATFASARTAYIDGAEVRFRHAVIATGATASVPNIPGLSDAAPLTSETIWDIPRLPRRLVIIGGGAIGCELGQAFARLGSRVTIVESADRILPLEHAGAAAVLSESLTRDGITLLLGRTVTSVSRRSITLDGDTSIGFDRVLVATGRSPRVADLGLPSAGVALNERGFVRTDAHLRTTNGRIWAAGDVTGHPQFTHTAGLHGSTAATNAVLGLRRKAEVALIPRAVFTDPEIGAVGMNPDDAVKDPAFTVRTIEHRHLDRAIAEADTAGFSTLVFDRRGRITGGVVVSPRAGETLGELTLLVRTGTTAGALSATMHAYPTFNDGVWNAAIEHTRAGLKTGPTHAVIRMLAKLRRASSR